MLVLAQDLGGYKTFLRQVTTELSGFSDNDTFGEGNEFLIHLGRRSK